MTEVVWRDVVEGAGRLMRRPVFTALALLMLAAGTGATTFLVSLTESLVLSPLPYPRAEELHTLHPQRPGADAHTRTLSEAEFVTLAERTRGLRSVAAYLVDQSVSVSTGETLLQLDAVDASASLFATLGVEPHLGRFYDAAVDVPGGPDEIVLSYGLWSSVFGADSSLIGRPLTVDGVPNVVVGVASARFAFPDAQTDVWRPLRLDHGSPNVNSGQRYQAVARLERADRLEVATQSLETVGEVRAPLFVLTTIALIALLTVCFNLAGHVLAATLDRRGELALRVALGASDAALIRSVVAEALILTLVGGTGGLLIAAGGVRLLAARPIASLPRTGELALDGVLFAGAVAVTLITAVAFSIAPGLHARRVAAAPALRTRSTGSGGSVVRRGLVVTQLGASVALVAIAGLLVGTLNDLRSVDPGFRTDGVLSGRVALPGVIHPDANARRDFRGRVLRFLADDPRVMTAGVATRLPGSGVRAIGFAWSEAAVGDVGALPPELEMRWIDGDFFAVAGIPLLAGRLHDERDRPDTPLASVMSRSLVERLWPGEDPLGKRWKLGRLVGNATPWRTVVGVVDDIRHHGPGQPVTPTVYGSMAQEDFADRIYLMVAANGPSEQAAEAMRRAVSATDPARPLHRIRPLRDVAAQAIATPTLSAWLAAGFSALVVLLATVGVYGLVARSIAARTHEFGVRMSVGATTQALVGEVISYAARLGLLGAALGLIAAALSAPVLTGIAAGARTYDPATYLVAALGVFVVVLSATLVPALRVSRAQPARILRGD